MRLIWPQELSHGKDVGERLLLQASQGVMAAVGGSSNAGTGALFRGDRIGKQGVTSAKFSLEFLAA